MITETYKKTANGVVINTNKSGFAEARKRRQKITKEKERINSMEKKIDSIELTLEAMLSILSIIRK